MPDSAAAIFTIGHSSRPWNEFLALLQRYEIELLCDVRTAPGSRKHPQYSRAALELALTEAGIGYEYCRELGGFRKAREDSLNSGWRNASFRGYADYMQTEEFTASIDRLVETAKARTTAIMCAEAVYWRCHRSLIADALTVRNISVRHILSLNQASPHRITRFAHVTRYDITYPPESE